jgi:hypothetical protein
MTGLTRYSHSISIKNFCVRCQSVLVSISGDTSIFIGLSNGVHKGLVHSSREGW